MATRDSPTEWDWFHKTARWKRLRKLQLTQHPLCKSSTTFAAVTIQSQQQFDRAVTLVFNVY
jgi:hypothetical protein